MSSLAKCPFMHTKKMASAQTNWWPNQLSLKPLAQGAPASVTNYAEKFNALDLEEVKRDIFSHEDLKIVAADYGHGPFFIRMAWQCGTYRTFDRRGGAGCSLALCTLEQLARQRQFGQAKRLLWPIKKKYGSKISWGDLMVYAGNCAIESMGLTPLFRWWPSMPGNQKRNLSALNRMVGSR